MLFVPAQWKFGDKIGSGAFGTVWSAVFRGNDKTYAVKKIRRRDDADMEDTQREVALMAQMEHRNIVRYYGGQAVPPGTFFWIVMEYMECGTVADVMRIRGGPLTEVQASIVARDMCRGLAYLHQMGVLHKDMYALAFVFVNHV